VRAWLFKSPPAKTVEIQSESPISGLADEQHTQGDEGDRLKVERADQTGNINYAATYNGAAVSRSGDRATTLALVLYLSFASVLSFGS
jgi:hypothetical protein